MWKRKSNSVNVTVELPVSPEGDGNDDNPASITGYNHWILVGSPLIGVVIIYLKKLSMFIKE